MSITFPPLILTANEFDVTVAGRTLTPVGRLFAGALLTPNATHASVTLTGASEGALYDLAVIALEGNTYGLTTYPNGGTPTDLHGVWKIGQVKDFPIEGRCQILLVAALAFQSDQYVQIEADGVHIRPFAFGNYAIILLESPDLAHNLSILASDSFARIFSLDAMRIENLNNSILVNAADVLNLFAGAGGILATSNDGDVTLSTGGGNAFVGSTAGTATVQAPTIDLNGAVTVTGGVSASSNTWTATGYNGTWTTAGSPYPALGYRKLLQTNQVQIQGGVTAGASTQISGAPLPSTHRPTSSKPLTAMYFNGSVWASCVVHAHTDGHIYAPNNPGVGIGLIVINGTYPND